jgi:dTDP-4-amino-4,6-dideoxygalactose transaminase
MSDKIKLFQTERSWQQIREQVLSLVDEQHINGWAQNGQLTRDLESRLARHFNRKHCVTTANCTDALQLAIISLDLPSSDIAVSNYTFIASAHAISRAGHQVVPIDVDDNYCINKNLIGNEAAVIAVDVFGNMSDINGLTVPVIIDAAQSLESHDGKEYSASRGTISCISFAPSKTVSSWGSGGALLTDDDNIANIARRLRLHGKSKNSDDSIHPGLNSMMSSFESACVWAGLDHSEEWQARRKKIAEYLIAESRHLTAIDTSLAKHTYQKLVFQSEQRDDVIKKFTDAGIDCTITYSRLVNDESLYHQFDYMRNSDKFKNISFTVPNQHTLTDAEVERIAEKLR